MAETRTTFQRSFSTASNVAVRGGRIVRAGAEFAVVAGRATQGQGIQGVRDHADAVGKFRRFKAEVGFSKESAVEARLYGLAGDSLTVAGLALSAIALPKMASQAATSFQELKTLVRDPNADPEARLNGVEKLARSSAGTVFAAQGVVVGTQGTYGILSRFPVFGRLFAKVGESAPLVAFGKGVGKVFHVVLPVADFAVLTGEAIAWRRTFQDPAATGMQKFRTTLNLGLATLKAAFWLFPQVRFLKVAYSFASFGQLSLALYDLKDTMVPHFKKAATNTAWALTHPGEAVVAGLGKLKGGAAWLAQGAGRLVAGTAQVLLHPVATARAVAEELGAWSQAYREGLQARAARAWYFLPWNRRPEGPAPAMPAPGALIGPAAPAAVAPAAGPAPASVPGLPPALALPPLPPPAPVLPAELPVAPPPPPLPAPALAEPAAVAPPALPLGPVEGLPAPIAPAAAPQAWAISPLG